MTETGTGSSANEHLALTAAEVRPHLGQTSDWNEDDTVTVRFREGGIDEMCWHLVTWGESVTVVEPTRLRRRLAEMCEEIASHHRAAD